MDGRSASAAHAGAASAPRRTDFSVVLGGPLFQLLCRAHLSTDALDLVHRRIALAVVVAWVPLALLSALDGAFVADGRQGFLHDIAFHLRFLVVVPLLVASEPLVHHRLRPVIEQFEARDLVRAGQRADFEAALSEALRARNSFVAEAVILAVVYAAGVFFTWQRYETIGGAGWYTAADGEGMSPAGAWLVFVSLPLLQFLLLRWYFRLFIWARFLWRVSRLDLDLEATHPDRAGGLGFLNASLPALAPLAAAHGVLLAGMMAAHVFFGGGQITDYRYEVLGGAALLACLFAGPLTVFGPQLARVKRDGLRRYGALGQDYARDFRRRWLSGRPGTAGETLLGSGDIQSLADLGNSYGAAEDMRLIPVRPLALVYVAACFLAPMAPLLLTMIPADELLKRLVGMVF